MPWSTDLSDQLTKAFRSRNMALCGIAVYAWGTSGVPVAAVPLLQNMMLPDNYLTIGDSKLSLRSNFHSLQTRMAWGLARLVAETTSLQRCDLNQGWQILCKSLPTPRNAAEKKVFSTLRQAVIQLNPARYLYNAMTGAKGTALVTLALLTVAYEWSVVWLMLTQAGLSRDLVVLKQVRQLLAHSPYNQDFDKDLVQERQQALAQRLNWPADLPFTYTIALREHRVNRINSIKYGIYSEIGEWYNYLEWFERYLAYP